MKKLVLLVALVTSGLTACADREPIAAAEAAANEWLAMLDDREYDGVYAAASEILRDEVTREDWVSHVSNMRDPLGSLNHRNISSSEYHESLPEAPPGQYVIFTYESSFENDASAAEVLALAKGSDGEWRVVGYYFG